MAPGPGWAFKVTVWSGRRVVMGVFDHKSPCLPVGFIGLVHIRWEVEQDKNMVGKCFPRWQSRSVSGAGRRMLLDHGCPVSLRPGPVDSGTAGWVASLQSNCLDRILSYEYYVPHPTLSAQSSRSGLARPISQRAIPIH